MGKMKELLMEELDASLSSPSPDEIWWWENESYYTDEL